MRLPDWPKSRSLKWLMPGMQVKRWLALLLAGITAMALGIAYTLIDAYRTVAAPGDVQPFLFVATLQFLPQAMRAILFLVIGLGMALGGLYGLNRSLLTAVAPEGSPALVDIVDRPRRRRSAANTAAIGGGSALSTLLRRLPQPTDKHPATAPTATDPGSRGR